jgi:hypothetical protein
VFIAEQQQYFFPSLRQTGQTFPEQTKKVERTCEKTNFAKQCNIFG